MRSNIDVGLFGKLLYMVWQFGFGDECQGIIYGVSWGLSLPGQGKHGLKISSASLVAREKIKEWRDK